MRRWLGAALATMLVATMANGQDNPQKQNSRVPQVSPTNTITGRCHCGYSGLEADGAKANFDDCACRGCQKASGSLKAQYVIVPTAALKITAGEPAEFRAKSGVECDAWGVWQFCPKCGAPVFWKSNKGDHIDIFAGTLDDPRVYKLKK